MKTMSIHPLSVLAGCGIAVLAFLTMGQQGPAPSAPAHKWEYKIVEDIDASALTKLAEEGWDYAGYLGAGKKGASNDETLWRRPVK